mmetsp:Transcript_12181/g.42757  ORF Transcript_12181/g.42757 Transcript_12181/m.42757 type:complete len:200 (+) Transcript_12181:259-858(+)
MPPSASRRPLRPAVARCQHPTLVLASWPRPRSSWLSCSNRCCRCLTRRRRVLEASRPSSKRSCLTTASRASRCSCGVTATRPQMVRSRIRSCRAAAAARWVTVGRRRCSTRRPPPRRVGVATLTRARCGAAASLTPARCAWRRTCRCLAQRAARLATAPAAWRRISRRCRRLRPLCRWPRRVARSGAAIPAARNPWVAA